MAESSLKFPFHLAVVVDDLAAAREFYGGLLGCHEGRSSDQWVDFNFFGHQFVCHLGEVSTGIHNPVDGEHVPVPHFGLVLSMDEWKALRDRLVQAGTAFILEPQIRFEGQVGEQATMFLSDPAGNHLEFKAMRHPENLFARDNGV
ncbi:MAG: VOC family protein [Xanthomonadales bacterium]|nr:VOC family protein [Xanthomonadales bacterium]